MDPIIGEPADSMAPTQHPPSAPADEAQISLANAAALSGHSAVSLRQAAQRGTLRAQRIGEGNRATWYTTRSDLEAYLSERQSWKSYRAKATL